VIVILVKSQKTCSITAHN